MNEGLLTVGDSFTYGDELANRETQAWPYLLANAMNTTVLNMGQGGASNDYIFRTAIEETAKRKFDLVIVGWAEFSRMEVWFNNKPVSVTAQSRWTQIGSFSWLRDFYKYNYNDQHAYKVTACKMLALQEYFKSIGQRYIFCNVAGLRPQGLYAEYKNEMSPIWNNIDSKFFAGWPHEGMLEWQGDCDKGPGGHPLELGHERISNKIYEHIGNISWVS